MEQNTQPEMPNLTQLSIDISLLIFQQVQIHDLLALRVSCRSIRALVDHQVYYLAEIVARNTFPQARLIFKTSPYDAGNPIRWMKSLIPQWLAAVAADKHHVKGMPKQRYNASISFTHHM
jgi:hypothetical protein